MSFFTTEALRTTETTEIYQSVFSVLILEMKIETTDFTDYTDYERVMHFMTFIIWLSLRLDRSKPSYPCNPLQSVQSVVKKTSATIFIFLLGKSVPQWFLSFNLPQVERRAHSPRSEVLGKMRAAGWIVRIDHAAIEHGIGRDLAIRPDDRVTHPGAGPHPRAGTDR
jgi:hypothetical protein